MGDDSRFNRDSSEFKGRSDGNVAKEVNSLLREAAKERVNDHEVFAKLKAKHGNNPELVAAIFDAYKQRLKYIYKKAMKFKRLIMDRYAGYQLSPSAIIKKAKKYQAKYKLTDDEFQMFVVLAMTDKSVTTGAFVLPHTKMATTLGYDIALATGSKMNVKNEELAVVEKIVRLHGETRLLHSQIVLQSLTYTDCAPEALMGKYDSKRHNAFNYIHPIVAALFLPKFNMLDEQMLIANIGYIVKCKMDGKTIMTKPDFDLYHAMINDPNDNVCTMPSLPGGKESSAVVDLKNRFELQTRLWDSVLNLRQGRYYHDRLTTLDFLGALDNCRNNVFDSPDLIYVRDEGAIIRRLLSAFSIRPTIVSIHRLYGVLAGPTLGMPNTPLDAAGLNQITTVPMVTLRLPLNINPNATRAVSLEDSLSQPQWFVENKMIIPKALQLVHSRDVLFFYVGRRFQTVNLSRLTAPYNFSHLPMTVSGFESLNDHPVHFERNMNILNDSYKLRSVICVERLKERKNLIVGCTACIVVPSSVTGGEECVYLYDPQTAAEKRHLDASGVYESQDPITQISDYESIGAAENQVESFRERACRRGTIFVYQKTSVGHNPFFPQYAC